MNSNNVCNFMGRLTADVEVKQTSTGISNALFTIAVDRPKTKNQPDPGTDFVRVKVWRGTAEYLGRNVGKGTMLAVAGSYRTDRWQDQNGQQREMTYIEAEDVRVADPGAIKRPANYVAPDQRASQQPQVPQGYAPQAGGYPQQGYTQQQMPQNYQQYTAPAPMPQAYVPQQGQQNYAQPPQMQQMPQQQMQYPGPGTAFTAAPAGYGGEGDFTPIPDGDLPF